jgi:hypothetical protein
MFLFFLSGVDLATAALKEGRKRRERAFLTYPVFRSMRSLGQLQSARQSEKISGIALQVPTYFPRFALDDGSNLRF